jgi:hypothetical protein
MGEKSMKSRIAVLVAGFAITSAVSGRAQAATLEITRNSREVTSQEAAGGAPLGGLVHDFFVTSDVDLLVLGPALDFSVYKHPYNSNHEAPEAELVALYPAVGASSFLRLPGSTTVLGGGFAAPGSAWGDFTNDGPQSQFQFGRLTTTQAGTFSGTFFVRGQNAPIELPFTMNLPGPGEGLRGGGDDMVSLTGTEPVVEPPTPAPYLGPDLNQRTGKEFSGDVSVEITRRSRAVTATEEMFGAPQGFVHEFFVTTSTDLISVSDVDIQGDVYQHARGSDRKPPNERVMRLSPASSADSFITTPGRTRGMGKGFYGNSDEAEIVWYDEQDDGALEEFRFAQLTVSETGSFAGEINVRGPKGAVSLPFEFVLPGVEGDLALLEKEHSYRLSLAFDELAGGVPEPGGLALAALVAPLLFRSRPRLIT